MSLEKEFKKENGVNAWDSRNCAYSLQYVKWLESKLNTKPNDIDVYEYTPEDIKAMSFVLDCYYDKDYGNIKIKRNNVEIAVVEGYDLLVEITRSKQAVNRLHGVGEMMAKAINNAINNNKRK